jgi:glyoxylase-like metal-dependent hydrolase (beta-lactamase superfamily II)
VYIQHHGSMHCDLRWFYLQAEMLGTRSATAPPELWHEYPTLTVVVDHPGGRLLFDTSCPRDWETRWQAGEIREMFPYDGATDEQYLDSSLARLGMDRGSFDTIVLSHLHFDHAGNLRLFEGSGANYVVQADEVAGALSIPAPSLGPYIREDYEGPFAFDTVEGDVELLPGVTLLKLPGHSWGIQAMLVELENSPPMLLASDVVSTGVSYGPPPVPGPVMWSSLDWLASVERVRKIAEKKNATIVFGHDLQDDLKLAPSFYD